MMPPASVDPFDPMAIAPSSAFLRDVGDALPDLLTFLAIVVISGIALGMAYHWWYELRDSILQPIAAVVVPWIVPLLLLPIMFVLGAAGALARTLAGWLLPTQQHMNRRRRPLPSALAKLSEISGQLQDRLSTWEFVRLLQGSQHRWKPVPLGETADSLALVQNLLWLVNDSSVSAVPFLRAWDITHHQWNALYAVLMLYPRGPSKLPAGLTRFHSAASWRDLLAASPPRRAMAIERAASRPTKSPATEDLTPDYQYPVPAPLPEVSSDDWDDDSMYALQPLELRDDD